MTNPYTEEIKGEEKESDLKYEGHSKSKAH